MFNEHVPLGVNPFVFPINVGRTALAKGGSLPIKDILVVVASLSSRPQDVEFRRLQHRVEVRVRELRHDATARPPEAHPDPWLIGHRRL